MKIMCILQALHRCSPRRIQDLGSLSKLSFRGWPWPDWLILLLEHTIRNMVRIVEPRDRGLQSWIQRVLEGRQSFATEFWGWVLPAQLILLLKRTLGNVM